MPFSERMSDEDLQREIIKAKARNPVASANDEAIYSAGGVGKNAIVNEIAQMAKDRASAASRPTTTYSAPSSAPAQQANPYADQQAALAAQQAQLDNVYSRYLAQIEAQERAAAEQKAAEQAARKEQYNLSRSNVNTAADDALRQAYIRKRQQMQQMPQQNALMGNGGLSETALLQLEADYGNNRANLEAERLAQLANLETQLNEGLAIDEGNYYARLQNIQQRQAEADMERELAMVQAANKAAASNEYKPLLTYSQAMDAYDRGLDSDAIRDTISYYTGGAKLPTAVPQRGLSSVAVNALNNYKQYGIGSDNWNKAILQLQAMGELDDSNIDAFNKWLSENGN